MQIQLYSLRTQPGCSAASPTSRTLILIFTRISLRDPNKAEPWSPLHNWVLHVHTPPFQTGCGSKTQPMALLGIFISKLSLHHCSALLLFLKVNSSAWHWNPFRKTTQQQPATPLKLRTKHREEHNLTLAATPVMSHLKFHTFIQQHQAQSF